MGLRINMNLKPNKQKILWFFIILVAIYLILLLTGIKIFPCYTWAVVPDAEISPSMCDLKMLGPVIIPTYVVFGIGTKHTVTSRVLFVVFFLIIPYLLACLIARKP